MLHRRAVFFDVENSSRVEHIAHMLEHLELGTIDRDTQLTAVGNWRVVGQETARLLARRGATLVHSAPAFGVKDWSDLRIAVEAGIWLGNARPGDVLVIITDDQAFDAAGDVAATRGVTFRRLSFRALARTGEIPSAPPRGRTAGGSRRGGPRQPREVPHERVRVEESTAHAAPHDEVLAVVRGLLQVAPAGAVTLDAVTNALQARGFRRPPGSLRLITRLRQMKELEVSAGGSIRLHEDAAGRDR